MKQYVQPFSCAEQIGNALKRGVLLTTKSGEKVNSMTIGWGAMGIEWNRNIFVVYVRQSRYTRELLDESGEFTVNLPAGECDGEILRVCGTASGRDTDKIASLGLHLIPSDEIGAPGIRELPLTLECKVCFRQMQPAENLPPQVRQRFYPEEQGCADCHIAYYGEIVKAWMYHRDANER